MTQELPEGTVTILFTDVEGSTDLTTRRGDEAARALMRRQEELVRGQIAQHSGHEVKSLGDGFMVAFASARRAVACAVAIQRALEDHNRRQPAEQQARVRIGLNAGEVIREEEDLFGAAVNAAARIAAKAQGSQILVSETVKALLGSAKDVQFADRGRFRLKGFPERWRLFEVIWQEEAPAAAAPILAERTPFVGRETEREELRGCLERAISGQGTLVMIGGEPGVGKTRLAEEVAAEARARGVLALFGRCYEMEGAPPYIPFVEMLEAAARQVSQEALREALGDSAPEVAKLLPELHRFLPDVAAPPQLPPEQERRYLFNGMRDFVRRAAQAQPLFLVVDDLHWADEPTLLLLQHLAQQAGETPVLMLGTYRDVELDVGRPLAKTLEELIRQRLAHRLPLRRLPETDVEGMLRALSGQKAPAPLVQVIYRETEGNPFFVEEVFKHLSEVGKLFDTEGRWRSELQVGELEVPEGVRLVIGRRLQGVSENCRRVLTTAAVVGRAFSFELLEALGELDADALLDCIDEAERAHLITAANDGPEARFTFAHELIRQTLVSSLSLPRRQRMHLRVAETMERVYTRSLEEHAADLAHHLYQAGSVADTRRTAHYLTLAAGRALAQAAYEDAVRLYELALQAVDLMEKPDDAERCELLLAMGDAQWKAGERAQSKQNFQRAANIARRLGTPEQLARAAIGFAEQGWNVAGVVDEQAVGLLGEALRGLGEQVSPLRASLLTTLGAHARAAMSHERALALTKEAVEVARRAGDSYALTFALSYRHNILWDQQENQEERLAINDETLRLSEKDRNVEGQWWSHQNRLVDLLEMGDAAGAGVEVEACARLAEELRQPAYVRWTVKNRAMLALMEGHLAEAEALAQQSVAGTEPAPDQVALGDFSVQMFALRSEQGRLQELEGAVRASVEQFALAPAWRAALAYLYTELGQQAEARREFERLAADDFAALMRSLGSLVALVLLSQVCAFLGDARRAATLHGLLLPYAGRNILLALGVASFGPASQYLGLLAATMSRWEEAERHFEDALEMNTRMRARPGLARTQHDYARMLLARRQRGDRQKALELVAQALDTAMELGMKRLADEAQGLMDSLRGLAPAYPGGLTQREVEVLRLIAAGKSSREIGGELFLSARTVERHISNIYLKVNAHGRAQATAYALQHGLVQHPT